MEFLTDNRVEIISAYSIRFFNPLGLLKLGHTQNSSSGFHEGDALIIMKKVLLKKLRK